MTPNRALAGQRPIERLRVGLRAQDVEKLIGRLENGVFV
jgi:uncharacterized protein (DUF2384 family)